MNWRKAMIQNVVAALPRSNAIYYALQRNFSNLRRAVSVCSGRCGRLTCHRCLNCATVSCLPSSFGTFLPKSWL